MSQSKIASAAHRRVRQWLLLHNQFSCTTCTFGKCYAAHLHSSIRCYHCHLSHCQRHHLQHRRRYLCSQQRVHRFGSQYLQRDGQQRQLHFTGNGGYTQYYFSIGACFVGFAKSHQRRQCSKFGCHGQQTFCCYIMAAAGQFP